LSPRYSLPAFFHEGGVTCYAPPMISPTFPNMEDYNLDCGLGLVRLELDWWPRKYTTLAGKCLLIFWHRD